MCSTDTGSNKMIKTNLLPQQRNLKFTEVSTDMSRRAKHGGMFVVGSQSDWQSPNIIILADSFFVSKREDPKQSIHFAHALMTYLDHVFVGATFLIVYKPGACFWKPARNDYVCMLEFIAEVFPQASPQSMLVISMGNDLHRPSLEGCRDSIAGEIQNFAHMARGMADEVHYVYGGSTELWRYPKHWMYDAEVRWIHGLLLSYGCTVTDGVPELTGIPTADRIGHITSASIPIALRAVGRWLGALQYAPGFRSRL